MVEFPSPAYKVSSIHTLIWFLPFLSVGRTLPQSLWLIIRSSGSSLQLCQNGWVSLSYTSLQGLTLFRCIHTPILVFTISLSWERLGENTSPNIAISWVSFPKQHIFSESLGTITPFGFHPWNLSELQYFGRARERQSTSGHSARERQRTQTRPVVWSGTRATPLNETQANFIVGGCSNSLLPQVQITWFPVRSETTNEQKYPVAFDLYLDFHIIAIFPSHLLGENINYLYSKTSYQS